MKITHDGIIQAGRYHWGEAYVISFISEIYKYNSFIFKSNKNYYVDETDPSIEIDNRFNKRVIIDFDIVLINVAKRELRKITKSVLRYVE